MASIGSRGFENGLRKYFYKLTRSQENDLILSKIEITGSPGETIELQDPDAVSAENLHRFRGFGTDYTYVNLYSRDDAEQEDKSYKDIIDQPLGVTQYQVRDEDFDVSVDENGNFIVSMNN